MGIKHWLRTDQNAAAIHDALRRTQPRHIVTRALDAIASQGSDGTASPNDAERRMAALLQSIDGAARGQGPLFALLYDYWNATLDPAGPGDWRFGHLSVPPDSLGAIVRATTGAQTEMIRVANSTQPQRPGWTLVRQLFDLTNPARAGTARSNIRAFIAPGRTGPDVEATRLLFTVLDAANRGNVLDQVRQGTKVSNSVWNQPFEGATQQLTPGMAAALSRYGGGAPAVSPAAPSPAQPAPAAGQRPRTPAPGTRPAPTASGERPWEPLYQQGTGPDQVLAPAPNPAAPGSPVAEQPPWLQEPAPGTVELQRRRTGAAAPAPADPPPQGESDGADQAAQDETIRGVLREMANILGLTDASRMARLMRCILVLIFLVVDKVRRRPSVRAHGPLEGLAWGANADAVLATYDDSDGFGVRRDDVISAAYRYNSNIVVR